MLSYHSTELHIAFKPFFHDPTEEQKAAAGVAVATRLAYLENRMQGPFLFEAGFSVADPYLFVMLRWAKGFALPLSPTTLGFFERTAERPSVQRALAEEA
jgi:glutathione S-transferase